MKINSGDAVRVREAGKCVVPVSARGQIQLCARRHALLLLLLLHLASSSITAEDEMLKLTGLPFPQSRAHWLFFSFSGSGPLRTLSLSRGGLGPLLRCVSGVLSFWALLVCSVTPFLLCCDFLSFSLSPSPSLSFSSPPHTRGKWRSRTGQTQQREITFKVRPF